MEKVLSIKRGDIVVSAISNRILRVKRILEKEVVDFEDPACPDSSVGTTHISNLVKVSDETLAAIAPHPQPVKIDLIEMTTSVRYVRDHLTDVFGVDPGLKPCKDIVDAMRAKAETAQKRWSDLMSVYHLLTSEERERLRGILDTAD